MQKAGAGVASQADQFPPASDLEREPSSSLIQRSTLVGLGGQPSTKITPGANHKIMQYLRIL
jgi:hypothetical protein